MKKIILFGQIAALAMLFADASYASGGDDRGHHYGHHGKHHRHHDRYYAQPGPYYGPTAPTYQDGRSHQGLAGGVVGSVVGYEVGNGNPLATGLGAAAGSLIGNEMSGRR